jgi:hypothetical protein
MKSSRHFVFHCSRIIHKKSLNQLNSEWQLIYTFFHGYPYVLSSHSELRCWRVSEIASCTIYSFASSHSNTSEAAGPSNRPLSLICCTLKLKWVWPGVMPVIRGDHDHDVMSHHSNRPLPLICCTLKLKWVWPGVMPVIRGDHDHDVLSNRFVTETGPECCAMISPFRLNPRPTPGLVSSGGMELIGPLQLMSRLRMVGAISPLLIHLHDMVLN